MDKGIVPWFARNGVAANLLMIIIIVSGALTIPFLKKEIFPEYAVDIVTVQVRYLGAAPEEVEEGVCVRVEEAIQDLDGIKQIRATAAEGVGSVTIEVIPGYDTRKLLDDVKARVDAIDTFPAETEKPTVQEITNRFQVVNVSVSGDADAVTLKRLGEQVRDEIMDLPGVTQAELVNAPPYEISIEVSEEAMRRYGLTFDEVAFAVRRSSFDLPGGSLKTKSGEILLRTKGQAYRGEEFEKLTLLAKPDGTKLRVGDVARVVDGFAETDQWSRLDGKPAFARGYCADHLAGQLGVSTWPHGPADAQRPQRSGAGFLGFGVIPSYAARVLGDDRYPDLVFGGDRADADVRRFDQHDFPVFIHFGVGDRG